VLSQADVDVRRAAQAAHVPDFIMTLRQGYDTMVGENASLISGGQAQWLQIARRSLRPNGYDRAAARMMAAPRPVCTTDLPDPEGRSVRDAPVATFDFRTSQGKNSSTYITLEMVVV
jgi:hypothetical protein